MIHDGDYEGRHGQVDDNDDHASFASDQDSHGHRLPRRRLRRQNADSSATSSDADSGGAIATQGYEGSGISARGDDREDGYPFPLTPRGYSGRAIRARRDEYNNDGDGQDGPSTLRR